MKIENLKIYNGGIYSGSIYSWGLARQPLVGNYPTEYREFNSKEIAELSDYNQEYFIFEKRIVNQAFFVGYDDMLNATKEVLTGFVLPASNLDTSNNRFNFQDICRLYIASKVHIRLDEIHEELDVTRVEKYIKEVNPQNMKKIICDAQKELDIIIDFFGRQYEYKKENKEKVMQFAKQIQDSWKN